MCFVYFDSARVWWTDEWTELTAHASLCNLASFGCLQIRDFQKEIHTLQPEMIREYIDTCHSSLATVLCTGNTPCAWHRLYPVLMTVGADESFVQGMPGQNIQCTAALFVAVSGGVLVCEERMLAMCVVGRMSYRWQLLILWQRKMQFSIVSEMVLQYLHDTWFC